MPGVALPAPESHAHRNLKLARGVKSDSTKFGRFTALKTATCRRLQLSHSELLLSYFTFPLCV
jgi:hypothetical protein